MILLGVAADIGEGQDDDREARGGDFFRRRGRRRLRVGGPVDVKRIDPDRFGNVLELGRAEIGHGEIEPPLDLPIGLLGQADRARLGNAFQSRRDIDSITHQVAVALLDDVAQMNANAKQDPAVLWDAGIALDHGVLHLDGAAHGVDHAAELNDAAAAGALDHAPVVHGNGRVDDVASQRPEPRQDAILVRTGKPGIADHVRAQNRREFACFGHECLHRTQASTNSAPPATRLDLGLWESSSYIG